MNSVYIITVHEEVVKKTTSAPWEKEQIDAKFASALHVEPTNNTATKLYT